VFAFGTVVCFAGLNALYARERYYYWESQHRAGRALLDEDVCKHASKRLFYSESGYLDCAKAQVGQHTSPALSTLHDVLETNYLCGGGACVWWAKHLLALVLLAAVLIGIAFVFHTKTIVSRFFALRQDLTAACDEHVRDQKPPNTLGPRVRTG